HARLRKVEADLRQVLASVSDCLWSGEIDPSGRWVYRYFSPVVQRITGRPPEFFLPGLPRWWQIVLPADRPLLEAAIAGLRAGQPAQAEYRIVQPNGVVRWVSDNVLVKPAPGGRGLRLNGVLADVTARRRAEEALHQDRHLLHTLMDNIPDTIYFKDTESHFTRINKAQAVRFGLASPDQAVGRTDFDYFTEEHARQAKADEEEVMRSGRPLVEMEEKETWPNGAVTWVATTKMPLRSPQGVVIGPFGMSRDITARKRVERRMALQHRVTRILAESPGLAEAVPRILQALCEGLGWDVGAMWQVD